MIFAGKYDQALTEFLIILFDTVIILVLIPLWISAFCRLRESEKKIAVILENIRWIIRVYGKDICSKKKESDKI